MTDASIAEISARFTRWLKRFSPPRQIANDREAMQDDADALLRIILEQAPRADCLAWYDDAIHRLEVGMNTRAWPAPGEVMKACRSALAARPSSVFGNNENDPVIDLMIVWHNCKGRQMPGYGTPARTRELIRRGVLHDIADARHRGYAICSEEQRKLLVDRARRRAAGECMADIMDPAEYEDHIRVLAGLKGISDEEARREDEGSYLV